MDEDDEEEEDEDEEEEGDVMAVDGADGQQYVVLEVIQLADGEEQAVVVGDNGTEVLGESILPDHGELEKMLQKLYN